MDDVTRVARTPIRKLGYDERFIRPIRELRERGLSYDNLLKTVAYVFDYKDDSDQQSVELQSLLAQKPLAEVVKEVTGRGVKKRSFLKVVTSVEQVVSF